ncbi:hypothetical protein ACF065_01695 [Streptomyces sp. NPDC015232]|uniref:hypothetical protein n=1 Tax=unclassified Streptomyces TaxID=2593676 RepID=UPI00370216D4
MNRFSEFDFGLSWIMTQFHQDWLLDADTAAGLVAKYLAHPAEQDVVAVRRDAVALLEKLPSNTLEVLWDAGAEYLPSRRLIGTGTEWTAKVVELCDARLSTMANVPVLSAADTEDGWGHSDAVIAEIEATQSLAADVRAGLIDCARLCAPELAFRLLLRVMVVDRVAALTPAHYARLEAIGADLHYGEFVVDNVRFLIDSE